MTYNMLHVPVLRIINARSLLPKIDMLQLWAESTGSDLIVVSQTWLSNSTLDKDAAIDGLDIYRSDRPRKGGRVAMLNPGHSLQICY